MNYPLAMRVLLFVKLPLNLFGIKELEEVWLKVETRKRLKMLNRRLTAIIRSIEICILVISSTVS